MSEPADSITVAIAADYDSVSGFHRFWLGEGYRKLWAAPVKVKVFDLKKEKGGLTILQSGGGLQTRSLRLRDPSGKEWVLRSIQKYPERGLPAKLRKTIARDILQDQVITGHPYAAMTVPPFAAALGISHSNPQVVFVPDDPEFGEYRQEFANSVLLFEERSPVDTLRTESTDKIQGKIEENNDFRVDQRLVLRARILDILLGDWDRHEDQWRWEKRLVRNNTSYTPVPRDRDKVYYNTTGFLPWILAKQNLKANLEGFNEDINNVHAYNYNNRYFDRYFLNQLSEEDWKKEIAYVQLKITDNLIRNAMRRLPDTIFTLSGEKAISLLISRRNNLMKQGLTYFRALAGVVDIPASGKHEIFEIRQKENGIVSVTIQKLKRIKSQEDTIYHRHFDPSITKEIRLYGLAGRDIFSVTGNQSSRIKIRMIGGDGRDSFYVDPSNANRPKLYVYDRSDEENVLPLPDKAKVRTSADTLVNDFDRRNFKYAHFQPIISLKVNRDYGALVRLGVLTKTQGFRKEPYAKKQLSWGSYSTARNSYMFAYAADYKKLIGQNDLTINLLSQGPHNISNFFGTGNETKLALSTGKDEIAFYRNRYDLVTADIRIKRMVGKKLIANAGIIGQYYSSSQANNFGRLLGSYDSIAPKENVFSTSYYGGVVAGLEINTRNTDLLVHKGIYSYTELSTLQQFTGDKNLQAKIQTELSFYIPIKDSTFVIANHLGGGTTFGSPAFFQQMKLGGEQNLRGYYNERFTGTSSLYYNLELRMKLFDFTSYLVPGTFGLIAFHDVGRVWTKGESSTSWHNGYGGGLYLIPADLLVLQAVIGHSKEGNQPYISVGFRF